MRSDHSWLGKERGCAVPFQPPDPPRNQANSLLELDPTIRQLNVPHRVAAKRVEGTQPLGAQGRIRYKRSAKSRSCAPFHPPGRETVSFCSSVLARPEGRPRLAHSAQADLCEGSQGSCPPELVPRASPEQRPKEPRLTGAWRWCCHRDRTQGVVVVSEQKRGRGAPAKQPVPSSRIQSGAAPKLARSGRPAFTY